MERFVQYVEDGTEGFDDYFPCRTERCCLEPIRLAKTISSRLRSEEEKLQLSLSGEATKRIAYYTAYVNASWQDASLSKEYGED